MMIIDGSRIKPIIATVVLSTVILFIFTGTSVMSVQIFGERYGYSLINPSIDTNTEYDNLGTHLDMSNSHWQTPVSNEKWFPISDSNIMTSPRTHLEPTISASANNNPNVIEDATLSGVVNNAQPMERSLQPANDSRFTSVVIGFHPGKLDSSIVTELGGLVKANFTSINAVAADIPKSSISSLIKDARVKYVNNDASGWEILGHEFYNSPGYPQGVIQEYKNSWSVDHIEADKVHFDITKKLGGGINVAFIDDGINYNDNQIKCSYKGGLDFEENDFDPLKVGSHGDEVSSVTAMARDNFDGVGVAPPTLFGSCPGPGSLSIPGANIYALKVNVGSYTQILAALQWSIDHGMNIVSMSFGGPIIQQIPVEMLQAANEAGILLIAGAGNEGNLEPFYPAFLPQVLAVGATDQNDLRASFSSYGKNGPFIMAPGVDIWTTSDFPKSGTSYATPHVTGVAALVWSNGIADTNTGVMDVLLRTADDIGPVGTDIEYGSGLLNAAAAVGVASKYRTGLELEPVQSVPSGKLATVTGRLLSTFVPPDPNHPDIGTSCSEPCMPVPGRTITFTGSGGVPSQARTDDTGRFVATFTAPTTLGQWDIQANFAKHYPYFAADSQVMKYITFADPDGDGIQNSIDSNPPTFSNDFSDTGLGGKTTGTITNRGDQILSITEEQNPQGVRITSAVSSGSAPSTGTFCNELGQFSNVEANSNFIITCDDGRVIVEVINGPPVEFTLFSSSGVTTPLAKLVLSPFNKIIYQLDRSAVSAESSNISPVPITLIPSGKQISLAPGQSILLGSPLPPPDSACGSTGGDKNPTITGSNNADTLIGTVGNNKMNGLAGNDAMNGCSGNDQMNGGANNDGMAGSAGNDMMHGDEGDDDIQGGSGNDHLFGDGGVNTLTGGEGNDHLFGDGGVNTLTGGEGNDVFICGPTGQDRITDFQPRQDSRIGTCL